MIPTTAPRLYAHTWRTKITNDDIEREIQAKGKTAPRITLADIEDNILSSHCFTAEEGVIGAERLADGFDPDAVELVTFVPELRLLTICVLVLRNGFTVTGISACASPENFDAAIGYKIARANAVEKVWPLMGYELKQRLSQE